MAIPSVYFMYLLCLTGEFENVDNILKEKTKLYGSAYSDFGQEYKQKKLRNLVNKNNILAIGGSRVMQFRQEMFKYSFYNAGGLIVNFKDLQYNKSLIFESKPKLIILACEQYFFNKNFYLYNKLSNFESSKNINYKSILYRFYLDLLKGKINIEKLINNNKSDRLGIFAIMENSGFRIDGSRKYPVNKDQYLNPEKLFEDINNRIDKKIVRYEAIDSLSNESLLTLDNFVSSCSKQNIKVILYLPSWPHSIFKKLKLNKFYGPYFTELPTKLKDIENKYKNNTRFYNFSDISKLGSNDYEFYDGHHGSEKSYARVLKFIYQKEYSFKEYINIGNVNKIINSKERFGLIDE